MRSNLSFNKLFLDKHYKDILEYYCIRKGLISNHEEVVPTPLEGIKKLFVLLALFETVDSNSSICDYSRLIELGLVNEDCILKMNNDYISVNNDSYANSAIALLGLYKKDVIKYIKRKDRQISTHHSVYKPNNKRTFYCASPTGKLLTLEDDFLEIVEKCDECYSTSALFDDREAGFFYDVFVNSPIELSIGSIKDNLVEGLYFCEKMDMTYASSIFADSKNSLTSKYLDELYYLVRTQLPPEINVLPMPQTLDEVIEMRKSPYLKSFRNVSNEWFSYIESGDINLALKIKNDIVKSNKMLAKLDRYKVFTTSPYYRVFNLIGGAIPILSTIMGVYSFLEPYAIESIQDKYGWSLVGKK